MSKLATLLATSCVACGGSTNVAPDSNSSDAAPDAEALGDGLSRCDSAASPRAMLVAISADDVVDLYAVHGGHLEAKGVHLTGISKPSRIVMRDDGAEALVAYGGFGSPFGVGVISIGADGASAHVDQVLQIGTDSTPMSIAYADHDHAVIALAAINDEVVGLARVGGAFVAGMRVAAPADYPLGVVARPHSQDVLMSRSQVGVDTTLDIYRLREKSNGTWQSAGAHASVAPYPIAMAMHASGNALYVPTGDPQHHVDSAHLDAPGVLHAVMIGSDTFTDGGSVALPRIASLATADPGGRFVVADGNVYVLDNSNNPNVVAYTWQTVRVGSDGALGDVFATTPPADGLLFDDFEVAPTGHLIAARELYEGSVPPAQQYPLELWAQPAWGSWQLCDTAYLSGGAHVAIGP